MSDSVWTWSWVCMVLGALLAVGGRIVASYRRTQEPYKGRTEATVVEIRADEPDEKGKEAGIHDYYYPVIAYYAGGRLIKKTYPEGGNPCPFVLNQKLHLYYDEKNPEKCRIARTDQLKKISRGLYFTGYGILALGGVLFLLYAGRFFLPFSD